MEPLLTTLSYRCMPVSVLLWWPGALYGPLHGGATEAVLRMLESIGSVRGLGVWYQDLEPKYASR